MPVPNAALLLRSSTIVLFPSQCSCMPLRGPCSQMDGKSAGPFFSCAGRSRIGKLNSTLAALKVSTRPGPQSGVLVHEVETPGDRQQPVTHERHRDRIDQVAVEQVQILSAGLRQASRLRHDEIGGELLILGTCEQEFLEPHDVELLRRHAEVHARFRSRCLAHRAGMAHRAVQKRLVDALVVPLRHADRKVVTFFVDESERRVAFSWQILGAHLRQRLEDPVRETRHVFAAGRPVLEMLLDVGVFDGAIAAETLPEINAEDERKQRRDRQHKGHDTNPGPAIHVGKPAVPAGCRRFVFVHSISPLAHASGGRQGRRFS